MRHVAPILPADAKPVCLMDAEPWQCRFVVGEPNGPRTIYCSAQRQSGSSYCQMHHRVCYTPAKERKR